jgi:2-(1,2-epoxy-1,2-dihydrophenyl)acetyl-CoA isomerase
VPQQPSGSPSASPSGTVPDAPVLLTEVTDKIGVLTLNRPARRNALNGELMAALDGAVKAMAADDGVKVVILTGAPPDALAGDLSRHDLHAAMLLHLMPKPTIAMVGGPAVGAGCSLAAACDLRFASSDAVFAANFSPNGLSGDYGGSFFWTRIGGTALARRLYLLNEKLPAARALELGMVHEVLAPQQLLEYTMDVARRLARTPAALLELVKDNLNAAEDEAARRRYLFAHEAENQAVSARLMRDRIRRTMT